MTVLLALALLASPADAGMDPASAASGRRRGAARAEGCLGLIARRAPEAAGCFAPGAAWFDARGAVSPAQGLERLSVGDYRWHRLSTGTWLGEGPAALVVLDLAGGPGVFSAARVYHAARRWPEPGAAGVPPPMDAAAAAAVFNETFGAGRVDEWLARWTPGAEFVSVLGPFAGPEVGTFFRNQAARYEPPRMTVLRDHGARADGALAMEGVLAGRCRRGGAAFEFPYLMLLRWEEGRLAYVWEAFARRDDGCGPFWAAPR